jgi:hypothetical protein
VSQNRVAAADPGVEGVVIPAFLEIRHAPPFSST